MHTNLTRSHALRNAIQEHEQAWLARQRDQPGSEPDPPVVVPDPVPSPAMSLATAEEALAAALTAVSSPAAEAPDTPLSDEVISVADFDGPEDSATVAAAEQAAVAKAAEEEAAAAAKAVEEAAAKAAEEAAAKAKVAAEEEAAAAKAAEEAAVGSVLMACRRLVLSPAFVALTSGFVRLHCRTFDDADENKLEYTALHAEYVELVEAELVSALHEQFAPDFDFGAFLAALPAFVQAHGKGGGTAMPSTSIEEDDELADVPQTIEILNRFSHFGAFKQDMLAAKRKQIKSDEAVAAGQKLYFSLS